MCLVWVCGAAAGNVLVVFLVIEAILFGLFTCCMMLDQWTVVSTNTTSKTCTHLQTRQLPERLGGRAHWREAWD